MPVIEGSIFPLIFLAGYESLDWPHDHVLITRTLTYSYRNRWYIPPKFRSTTAKLRDYVRGVTPFLRM